MRKDTGVDGDAQRLCQLSWLLFLKIFDVQDQNDEPASELLKRIAQEKAQLVKEGKIKTVAAD